MTIRFSNVKVVEMKINALWGAREVQCTESCPSQIHAHSEPQNMTLLGNRAFLQRQSLAQIMTFFITKS